MKTFLMVTIVQLTILVVLYVLASLAPAHAGC